MVIVIRSKSLNMETEIKFLFPRTYRERDLLLQILSDFIEGNKSISVCELQSVLYVYQLTPLANFAEHIIITPFEVVSNLKLMSLHLNEYTIHSTMSQSLL